MPNFVPTPRITLASTSIQNFEKGGKDKKRDEKVRYPKVYLKIKVESSRPKVKN